MLKKNFAIHEDLIAVIQSFTNFREDLFFTLLQLGTKLLTCSFVPIVKITPLRCSVLILIESSKKSFCFSVTFVWNLIGLLFCVISIGA